jgi:signal transduction histidine kinase
MNAMHALFRPLRFLHAFRSLQWQLAASYAAMAALLCMALSLVITQGLGHILLQQDTTDVDRRTVIVADLLYHDLVLYHDQSRPLPVVLAEASQAAQARVCALDATGGILGCSDVGLDVPPNTTPMPSIDSEVPRTTRPIEPLTTAQYSSQSSVLGSVAVDEPLTYRHATERQVQEAVFQLSLIATAIAAVVGLVLGRGLTAPLRALTDAARRVGSGNLNARAPQEGDDEIGELGAGFNRMASQLQDSFATLESERDALRTFIADMSHELRTPITALRTFNDLLGQGAVSDEDVRDEFIQESGVQIERLEWVAQNLLDLSKFDAGLAEVRVNRIDLRPLVQRVVDEARLPAERKGVHLDYQLPPVTVFAQADATRMQQALSNVLMNAVKFTPAGGHIEVSLLISGRWAMIHVQDSGPGIPPDELPHVFERFYRGPSTATTVVGSGLGLPIVQSIMHAHHGDVEVKSEPGTGTEVVLSLPAA